MPGVIHPAPRDGDTPSLPTLDCRKGQLRRRGDSGNHRERPPVEEVASLRANLALHGFRGGDRSLGELQKAHMRNGALGEFKWAT